MSEQQLQLDGLASNQKTEEIKIEILEPFYLTTPVGSITDDGMRELRHYLLCQGLGVLPEDFEPVWCTNRGTLPKRVQSYFFKQLKKKLVPEQVSEIGNIAKAHTNGQTSYILDFTNQINWEAGEFGDHGSCYWGDKSDAKEMLQDNGAYAVRAFSSRNGEDSLDYPDLRGYARAWLARADGGRFVVFNGYGETTATFARLLSLLWKRSYKRVALTNEGTDSGTLWINPGSFLIGHWSQIESTTNYDLGWEDSYRQWVCPVCDEYRDEDESVFAYEFRQHGQATLRVCENCCQYCDRCENNFTNGVAYNSDLREYHCMTCREEVQAEIEAEAEVETEVM